MGYFTNEGRRSCKQYQGEHWKTMLKNKFSNFKGGGGEIDTSGGVEHSITIIKPHIMIVKTTKISVQ